MNQMCGFQVEAQSALGGPMALSRRDVVVNIGSFHRLLFWACFGRSVCRRRLQRLVPLPIGCIVYHVTVIVARPIVPPHRPPLSQSDLGTMDGLPCLP